MALLFYSQDDDPAAWQSALARHVPDLAFRLWPDLGDPAAIRLALVWQPPPGLLGSLPNLEAIFSLAAGVDALLGDPTLPDVPLCRMVDTSLTATMAEYVLARVLHYHRRFDVYEAQARTGTWRLHLPEPAATTTVGIMGLGVLGQATAKLLAAHGFTIDGWSRTARDLPGVTCHVGEADLAGFLGGLDILVCLLPLTSATDGILNASLFAGLPDEARLIHVARGRHLVEADLLAALACGRLAHATLDVFAAEPLPRDHPFWHHPKVTVTPHSASYGQVTRASMVVAQNIRRWQAGLPLLHVVDRSRGY